MVSNNSSIQQDLGELVETGEHVQDTAHSFGIDIGYGPISGDPARLQQFADKLTQLSTALDNAGEAFKRIDTGGWTGPARDRFRTNYLETTWPMWLSAADGIGAAANAVRRYADALAALQQRAIQAKQALEDANARSEQAKAQCHSA